MDIAAVVYFNPPSLYLQSDSDLVHVRRASAGYLYQDVIWAADSMSIHKNIYKFCVGAIRLEKHQNVKRDLSAHGVPHRED